MLTFDFIARVWQYGVFNESHQYLFALSHVYCASLIIMNSCIANHFELILHLFSAVAPGAAF